MKTASTFLSIVILSWAMFFVGGCSKAPAKKNVVAVNFVTSGRSHVVTLTWPVSEQDKQTLQATVSKLQDGDTVSITASSPGLTQQGGEYQVKNYGQKFEVLRVWTGRKVSPEISGTSDQKDAILKVFVGHILKEADTMQSLASPVTGRS